MRFRVFALFAAGVLLAAFQARATVLREDIGELNIHDLLLRPNFTLSEPKSGAFSIGESSFALRWNLEERYSGVIRIGPRVLLNPSAHYSSTVNDDVTLVEAFAQYDDPYGRFRFGRLPVEFGYEGTQWERAMIFPRSLLFQNRAVMLRDVGVSYEINENGWFTGFVIHNGESDSDQDGQIWYTAKWGYRADLFEVGLAGQAGGTRASATQNSQDKLAGVDPSRDAKWRIGGFYGHWGVNQFDWVLEYYMGEVQQESYVGKFRTGHTDVAWEWTKRFSTHIRYDFFDPNSDLKGNVQQQVSLALVGSNKTKSSNLILVGTQRFWEGPTPPGNEIRLIWSLSPSGVVRF